MYALTCAWEYDKITMMNFFGGIGIEFFKAFLLLAGKKREAGEQKAKRENEGRGFDFHKRISVNFKKWEAVPPIFKVSRR